MKKKKIINMIFTIGLSAVSVFSIQTVNKISATTDTSVNNRMGDIDNNGLVDAVDSTSILIEYASLSTVGETTFTDEQKKSADINMDNIIDASDASYVLSYYAYTSTGGELAMNIWYNENKNPETSTTTVTEISQTTTTTTTAKSSPIVSDIRLTKYDISIPIGGKDISYVVISPENAPNKDEIWTTSDEKIATVDNLGYITGVSEGECIVTVKSVDNPEVKADINVKVYKSTERITDIKLSKYSMNLQIGDKDISEVTLLPETVENKNLVWTSSDMGIAHVAIDGTVTGISEGTCIITVSSVDNPEVTADIKVNVTKEPYKKIQQIDGITYVDGILIANKSYSLPSTYAPGMDETTLKQFKLLSEAASKDGLNIYLSSGYRSYSYQSQLYNNYVSWYGKQKADTFSARPGHSEHQTGLAIDVNTIDDSFAGTPEAIWLENHAHEFGFIIRYQKGKEDITGYKYEPWHIRYLGVEKATDVYNSGLSLEEYLGIDSYYH